MGGLGSRYPTLSARNKDALRMGKPWFLVSWPEKSNNKSNNKSNRGSFLFAPLSVRKTVSTIGLSRHAEGPSLEGLLGCVAVLGF